MTAPATVPAISAREAHAVLDLSLTTPWPQEREAGKAIARATWDLADALSIHEALEDGSLHWEAVYPGLDKDAPDPDGAALEIAERDTAEAARALLEAIAKHIGDETAAMLGGQDGGRDD